MSQRQAVNYAVAIALTGLTAVPASAYTPTGNAQAVTATAVIQEQVSFDVNVVAQGSGTPAAQVNFGTVGNTFVDSGEALEVNVTSNLANSRVIIYSDNLSAGANPQAALNTGLGIDGAGLVGVTDTSKTVPMVWKLNDTNTDVTFDGNIFDGVGETFLVDKAHVATFVSTGPCPLNTPGNPASGCVDPNNIDGLAMEVCDTNAAVANTAGDGLYPQFFGNTTSSQDLCEAGTNDIVSAELVGNIATVGYLCSGNVCQIVGGSITSPFYLAVGADFTGVPPQSYQTNTLTVELITL